jgi:C4-dicarboxylate-specific signal transduction histidine kinase
VVRTAGGPAGVQVFVSDNGPGLSDQTMERMFEPFFTTKPGGLGLGLAISRTIISAHGGQIRVVRHVDRGSFAWWPPRAGEGEWGSMKGC